MLTLLLALACNGDDKKPAGTDDSQAETDTDTDTDADSDTDADTDTDTDSYLTVTELPTPGSGTDLSTCYGFDEAWKDKNPNPDCMGVAGKIWLMDFETGDPVEAVTVDLHEADTAGSAAAASDETNANGRVNVEAPSCKPATWSAHEAEGIKKTITQHVLLQDEQDLDLLSMSETTFNIIPSLLGVTVEEGKGIVMGRVMGCQNDPVKAAQVLLRTQEGVAESPDTTFYFVDEFPNRDQPFTGPDGWFIVANVPTGQRTIEAWVWDGEGHALLGKTPVQVQAGAATLVNVHTGLEKGVVMPTACISCE